MQQHSQTFLTTSRPLRLFVADQRISIEPKSTDQFTDEHGGEKFAALNATRLAPALDDDGVDPSRNRTRGRPDRWIARRVGNA